MAPAAMKTDGGACVDLETIAAYLDHRLTERERAQVAEHLGSCESCYFVFTEAAQMRASDASRQETEIKLGEPQPASASKWWAAPRVVWPSVAGLAAAAVLALAVGTGLVPGRTSQSPELRRLVAAVGTDRVIEPRMTGGFLHAPMRTVFRGNDPQVPPVSPDVRITAAEIERKELGRRTPDALRILGLSYLVVGDVGRAVTALETAVDVSSGDAHALSDLAAAYITRASRTNQSQDLTKALAAADRAVKSDPGLAEAWFNRACALERLSLTDEAQEAWSDYLRVDGQSGWADEARAHLRVAR